MNDAQRSKLNASSKMNLVQIRTNPYQLNRLELSLLSAMEYLRMFWWYVAIVPTFGLLLLIFTRGPLQAIGMMAVLWPLTIPGRAFMTSSKSSRLFNQPCYMEADDTGVVFYSVATEPKRLRYAIRPGEMRDLVDRGDLLLIRTRKLGFAPIKKDAFPAPEVLSAFRVLVDETVEARLSAMPDV
jgi:hypothetical protein